MKMRYSGSVRSLMRLVIASAVLLIVWGSVAYALYNDIFLGSAAAVTGILTIAIAAAVGISRRKKLAKCLKMIESENGEISSNIITSFPIPVVIANIDGSVKWYNELFAELFNNADMYEKTVNSIIPDLKWSLVLKKASGLDFNVEINGQSYQIVGNMIKDKNTASVNEDKYSIYLYMIDKTTQKQLETLYENERTDVAYISVDNYDEVIQRVNDNEQQQINSQIRNYISKWAGEGNAIIKKTDRDRYFMMFEHRYLDLYIQNKFDILDNVRNISENINVPITISIGIGAGSSLSENEGYARNALEMTLGRGGDQVCIKDEVQYKFYGGKTKEYEKSTRVKTRAVAIALKDFIKNSDKVVFMGHYGADYDCFGAAMGLQRAVRTLGKEPYIIYDNNSPAIHNIYETAKINPEYRGMFVSTENMIEHMTKDTLLVILDTHRPSMFPSRELLELTEKVVLIDHHRRSTEFISPCSLVYHEPYASSTCEMATELLEYMDLGGTLTRMEAECLYMGILMDTKNFIVKTGVRTFEAASYLRRLGLNTVDVKKMFNVSKIDYDHKVDIVKTAVKIAPSVAVARCYEKYGNIRVIASQAADEMLNIEDIRASIVVYPIDSGAGISARSLGDINVQLIMEALGGGGHMTVAGAQLKSTTVDSAVMEVRAAVETYFRDLNK